MHFAQKRYEGTHRTVRVRVTAYSKQRDSAPNERIEGSFKPAGCEVVMHVPSGREHDTMAIYNPLP